MTNCVLQWLKKDIARINMGNYQSCQAIPESVTFLPCVCICLMGATDAKHAEILRATQDLQFRLRES